MFDKLTAAFNRRVTDWEGLDGESCGCKDVDCLAPFRARGREEQVIGDLKEAVAKDSRTRMTLSAPCRSIITR